ncbi:hypothetical protein EBU99_06660 [bacterium]|nr:hypothetical protein [bacterium]
MTERFKFVQFLQNSCSVSCIVASLTMVGACKRNLTSDVESADSRPAIISGFVTRENGYVDTAVGRKHVVSMAARIGVKRLFVDMWSRGCTLFKSSVVKEAGGPEKCPEAEGDPLTDFIKYGKALNVEIVPWFEWGNILPASSRLWSANKNSGWSGFPENFHSVPSIRLNPYEGTFATFMSSLLREVAVKYGSKEIHICDNFAPHMRTGKSAEVLKGPKKFTTFMQTLTAPARSAGAKFSLSSQRNLNSLQDFSIDWKQWLKNGTVEWVYPELYHVKEGKLDQFFKEARSEREAGAVGIAIYSGPTEQRWSLEGLGRFVKSAQSLGLETALFDFNTLLKDEKANDNADVQRISARLGTRMRTDLPSLDSTSSAKASSAGNASAVPPPAPSLPPPAPILPPPENTNAGTPQPNATETVASPSAPVIKTRLCEYMKISGAPEGGIPTYASAGKGPIIEYVGNDQLVYRYLTQLSEDGESMMYVTIQTGAAANRVRWLQAKYLVERKPDSLTCEP